MKPYLLVSGDFVTTGGMDRANHALASYLAGRGHELHLVAHRVAEDLLARPNVTFHRVPKPAGSYLLGGPLLDRAGRQWAGRIAARGGRVVVNGGNCLWGDVNWAHYVHAAYAPRAAGGLLRQMKVWLAHRTSLASEFVALRRARVVIANSDRTRRDLVRLGVAEDRVRVVYYGADPDAFRPVASTEHGANRAELGWPIERPVVAFVGALGDRRKGFDTLVEAWARLCRDAAWDVDLAVVGTGAELPALRSRASAAGLGERVRFLGFRTDVRRVLAACDGMIAPSRYEAYGLGVQEALCAGLPVIVSADAGIAERIEAAPLRELLLNDPEDASELCNRLTRWRGDRERFAALAAGASDAIRRHTWRHAADQFLAAIGEAPACPGATSVAPAAATPAVATAAA